MVLDTEKRPRKSWVVWREQGKYPDVIVEILSDSTANIDRNKKKILYQNTFRTPNYFWFDPESLELQGFRLIAGQYQAIAANENGYLWSEQLELYLGIFDRKLRYFTTDGQLVPTPHTLHPTPDTLHPTPYTLHPTPSFKSEGSKKLIADD